MTTTCLIGVAVDASLRAVDPAVDVAAATAAATPTNTGRIQRIRFLIVPPSADGFGRERSSVSGALTWGTPRLRTGNGLVTDPEIIRHGNVIRVTRVRCGSRGAVRPRGRMPHRPSRALPHS